LRRTFHAFGPVALSNKGCLISFKYASDNKTASRIFTWGKNILKKNVRYSVGVSYRNDKNGSQKHFFDEVDRMGWHIIVQVGMRAHTFTLWPGMAIFCRFLKLNQKWPYPMI
jgi:hypothetical protein